MTPIISYLQDGHLPQSTEEAKKIKKRAARFTILNDALYKRGFSMLYLKCVDEEEARYILEEIHRGICGDHAGQIPSEQGSTKRIFLANHASRRC